jgi:RNA polymerase sigma-70 factor, ECF subfamily
VRCATGSLAGNRSVFNTGGDPVFSCMASMASDPQLHVVRGAARTGTASVSPVALIDRSDEDLMVASAAGHRDAFEVLVARYLPRLTSYCAKLTRDARAAEDLAQDTLLALWQSLGRCRPEHGFRVLAFTIALNRCRNHARSWRRRLRWLGIAEQPQDIDAAVPRDPVHLDQLLELERQRHVRAALARLTHRARAVLLLRFEQELSYAEIARIVGKREATVRSQVFHALRKLACAFDEESHDLP